MFVFEQTILAATEPYEEDNDTLITFGPSPTFGELGYGQMEGGGMHGKGGVKKSSTVPIEVPDIKGAVVLAVSMGFAHSCCIVKTTGKSTKILKNLKIYDVKELSERNDLDEKTPLEGESSDAESSEEEDEPKKKKRKVTAKKKKAAAGKKKKAKRK